MIPLAVTLSPEGAFAQSVAASCFPPSPTEPVWQWAEAHVWLDEKQASRPGFYDSSLTPWTREIQQRATDPDTRELVIMKSSQTGVTEAALNVLRWMPEHWPGNALYAINSREKARDVSNRRILPTVQRTAGAQLTENPDDLSTLKIGLRNMEIVVSGSGSPGAFMEAWYRLIILDELENHEQNQGTTTYDRARSRQSTVADAKIFAISKPEYAGGMIDQLFIRGTQEKFLIPCPRCAGELELVFDYLVFSHCKSLIGWDLDRVLAETFYQCQLCKGRIDEHEKRAMTNAGRWAPAPEAARRRPTSGNAVAPEPGVASFHVSDLYSNFPGVTWGHIVKEYLAAYILEPSESRQKYFRTSHLGLPWEQREYNTTEERILALVAGRVEERDGVKVTLGEPFELVYRDDKLQSELTFKPALLTLTADKQGDRYRALVYAWKHDGQAFLVDVITIPDDEAFMQLRFRSYPITGHDEPAYIFSGLVDCGYLPLEVFRLCLRCQALGWEIHPSRGAGFDSNFRGRSIYERTDFCDGLPLVVRVYYDHSIKCDFYLGKIGRRSDPRLWLPRNVPDEVLKEWRAERFVKAIVNGRTVYKFEHERNKDGPNDLGDCGKLQYVMFQEMKEELAALPAAPVLTPPPA